MVQKASTLCLLVPEIKFKKKLKNGKNRILKYWYSFYYCRLILVYHKYCIKHWYITIFRSDVSIGTNMTACMLRYASSKLAKIIGVILKKASESCTNALNQGQVCGC
jgi:hypothetical protein